MSATQIQVSSSEAGLLIETLTELLNVTSIVPLIAGVTLRVLQGLQTPGTATPQAESLLPAV